MEYLISSTTMKKYIPMSFQLFLSENEKLSFIKL